MCANGVEGSSVGTAEHASERAPVELDDLELLTAFAHADASLVRHIGVPDRVLCIEADAVWWVLPEIGEDPPTAQGTVLGDVERGQSGSV